MTPADLAAIYAACDAERAYLAAAVAYARATWREHRFHRAYGLGNGPRLTDLDAWIASQAGKTRATAALERAALAAGWLL